MVAKTKVALLDTDFQKQVITLLLASAAPVLAIGLQWQLEHIGRELVTKTRTRTIKHGAKYEWVWHPMTPAEAHELGISTAGFYQTKVKIGDPWEETITETYKTLEWSELTTPEAISLQNISTMPPILSMAHYLASIGAETAKDAADLASKWMDTTSPEGLGDLFGRTPIGKLLTGKSPI